MIMKILKKNKGQLCVLFRLTRSLAIFIICIITKIGKLIELRMGHPKIEKSTRN